MCATLPTHWSVRFLVRVQLIRCRGCTSAWLVSLCLGLAGCGHVETSSSINTSTAIQIANEAESSEAAFDFADAEIEEPTVSQPIAADISIVPKLMQPGGPVTVVVRVKTASGWHIYPPGWPTGAAQPISLQLELPDNLTEQGEWVYPPVAQNPHGSGFIYEGALSFRHTLHLTPTAVPGPVHIKCQFRYQACDPFSCRPPTTLTLEATANVTNKTVRGGP